MRQVGHLTWIRMSEMQAKFNLENFKKSRYMGDLLVDGRILKFLLKTQAVRGWIGFRRLEIGANDVLNVVKRER